MALVSVGLRQGDCLHIYMNNNIYYHALVMAVWKLGGRVSCGDAALNADSVKQQVSYLQ